MKTINCAFCNVEYSYEPPQGHPDQRKYCDACSAEKKASYEAAKKKAKEFVPETVPTEKPLKTLEYEIRERAVRAEALKCAISFSAIKKFDNIGDIKTLAGELASWIKDDN